MREKQREIENERLKQMVELLNVQTSLGSSRVHIVDSSPVITEVMFLTATFHALVVG